MAEKWLVIDDSATIQRVIKLAFQDFDVLITEADSIHEALRELIKSPSSLVIADAALAGVQSAEDFSRLQQSSPQSAFIILEGSYDHIDESQLRSAGFRHFLKKPFDAQQLLAITRTALGRAIPTKIEAHDPPPPPPPLPGLSPRSLHDELDKPFGNADAFDLGLEDDDEDEDEDEDEKELSSRAAPLSQLSHDELFATSQIRAKPYVPDSTDESASSYIADSSRPGHLESPYNPAALNGMLEPMLRAEMEKIIRHSVEEYCRKNFADLTREFLSREIERLSSERTRLLVDK